MIGFSSAGTPRDLWWRFRTISQTFAQTNRSHPFETLPRSKGFFFALPPTCGEDNLLMASVHRESVGVHQPARPFFLFTPISLRTRGRSSTGLYANEEDRRFRRAAQRQLCRHAGAAHFG